MWDKNQGNRILTTESMRRETGDAVCAEREREREQGRHAMLESRRLCLENKCGNWTINEKHTHTHSHTHLHRSKWHAQHYKKNTNTHNTTQHNDTGIYNKGSITATQPHVLSALFDPTAGWYSNSSMLEKLPINPLSEGTSQPGPHRRKATQQESFFFFESEKRKKKHTTIRAGEQSSHDIKLSEKIVWWLESEKNHVSIGESEWENSQNYLRERENVLQALLLLSVQQ